MIIMTKSSDVYMRVERQLTRIEQRTGKINNLRQRTTLQVTKSCMIALLKGKGNLFEEICECTWMWRAMIYHNEPRKKLLFGRFQSTNKSKILLVEKAYLKQSGMVRYLDWIFLWPLLQPFHSFTYSLFGILPLLFIVVFSTSTLTETVFVCFRGIFIMGKKKFAR